MAEQFLDRHEVGAGIEQVGSKGVAERVHREPGILCNGAQQVGFPCRRLPVLGRQVST
jgi:hypothetical protein